MSEPNPDPELNAIQSIVAALESLDADARQRVVTYVFQRLRLSVESQDARQPASTTPITQVALQQQKPTDIRTLKEQKSPRTVNEMCALVAYYLAELAPLEERKDSIDKDDVEKYFKQAGFPLPKAVRQALPNAVKAGYFYAQGGGKFKLNPVGHNLVVHGLPSKQQSG